MLDPDLTNVLKRRIGASLIDLGVVGLVSTLVWRSQLIAFPITSTDAVTGEPIFAADQVQRQIDIAKQLHTSFTWDNTLYVLDRTGFVFVTLAALVMLTLVAVLIPANVGWTPGKKAMSLAVVDADGRNPSLVAYLKRAVVGLVDLLPIVIPGLAGWVISNSHEYRQRLGDRIAGTYVIDNRTGAKFIDPSVYERRRELRRVSSTKAADSDDMVQIGDRLGGSPSGLHREDPENEEANVPALAAPLQPESYPAPSANGPSIAAPVAIDPPAERLPPTPLPTITPSAAQQPDRGGALPPLPDLGLAAPSADEMDLSRLAPPSSGGIDAAMPAPTPAPHPTPAPAATEVDRPFVAPAPQAKPPTPTMADTPAPPPRHRFTVDADGPTNELGFVDDDQNELGLVRPPIDADPAASSFDPAPAPAAATPDEPADRIMTDPDLDEYEPADQVNRAVDEISVGREPSAVDVPVPSHRATPSSGEQEWDQPVPEPAPVWEPDARPTSAAGLGGSLQTTDRTAPTATIPAEKASASSAAQPAAANGLVWNEQWQAWLFWDAEHEHWLRHDIANDRWVPIT